MSYPAAELDRPGLFGEARIVVRSTDPHEARARVGSIFKPHSLGLRRGHGRLRVEMAHRPIDRISINRIGYGASVLVDPDRLGDFFLVMLPTRGAATVEVGRHRFDCAGVTGAILSPCQPNRLEFDEGCEHVILRIEERMLDAVCRAHLGPDWHARLQFEPRLRMDAPQAAYFLALLRTLVDALATDDHPIRHPVIAAQLEAALCGALLFGQPSAASAQLAAPAAPVAPRYVRRAEEYALAHLQEPLTADRLAGAAQVGSRTLFAGFQRYRGRGPMDFVREARLARVREELVARHGDASASVAEIATHWGFAHLSRFAADYRRRYGEPPSRTLRGAPADGAGSARRERRSACTERTAAARIG